jgi:uncharacterized protein with HEPN domain
MADREYILIKKIIKHIDKINEYAADMEQSVFLSDTKIVEACVFNLLQIGELTGNMCKEFRDAHFDIPWHKIRGLRNKIVHDYEGVRLEIIWDIVRNDLPILREQLINILSPDS